MAPNDYVFNSENNPLYVVSESSASDPDVISSIAANAAANRQLYRVSTGSITVVASGYLVMQITNSSILGKIAYMSNLYGGASNAATVDIFRNATFAATGSPLTPRNSYFGASDSSDLTVKYISQLTDPTSGGQLLSSVSQASGSFVNNFDGTLIVPPGNTVLLRLTNQALTNNIGLNASWWEL